MNDKDNSLYVITFRYERSGVVQRAEILVYEGTRSTSVRAGRCREQEAECVERQQQYLEVMVGGGEQQAGPGPVAEGRPAPVPLPGPRLASPCLCPASSTSPTYPTLLTDG